MLSAHLVRSSSSRLRLPLIKKISSYDSNTSSDMFNLDVSAFASSQLVSLFLFHPEISSEYNLRGTRRFSTSST